MSLKTQLLSLGFSFVFGFFFMLLIKFNYKFLFLSKKLIRIIGSFLFVFDMALLYFLIIKIINNGILHIYFLFMLLLGSYAGYSLLKYISNK